MCYSICSKVNASWDCSKGQTNGLAERAVQIFKAGMRKITDGSTADRIARILLNYRRTPQTTTGSSPAELMFGRNLRTRLDLLLPNLSARVE